MLQWSCCDLCHRAGLRYMLGLSVVPAVLQFLGFLFLPESPRWLLQKGLTQKAWQVLSKIRGTAHVDEEYDAIKTSIEQEGSGGGEQTNTYIYETMNLLLMKN